MRLLFLVPLAAGATPACSVSADPPTSAMITGRTKGGCPTDWTSLLPAGRCHRLDAPPPRCGDGVIDGNEACDCSDDGCSPDCLSDESCGNGDVCLAAAR